MKVVRPERAEPIVDRHRMLRAAGLPVPAVLGWSPAGVIVLEASEGTALTVVAGQVDPAAVVREIDALRSGLASIEGLAASDRASVPSRAAWYAARLAERMPLLADRLRPLVAVAAGADADAPLVAVHGDLHAGQLFVEPGSPRIAGLIDVDTLALADVGTDSGAFIAHALASAELSDSAGDAHRAAGFRELGRHGASAWLGADAVSCAEIGPTPDIRSAVRHTVGQLLAQAMQLATAHRLEPSAERLVTAAEHVAGGRPPLTSHDEDPLIGTTTTPHPSATV